MVEKLSAFAEVKARPADPVYEAILREAGLSAFSRSRADHWVEPVCRPVEISSE